MVKNVLVAWFPLGMKLLETDPQWFNQTRRLNQAVVNWRRQRRAKNPRTEHQLEYLENFAVGHHGDAPPTRINYNPHNLNP